MIEYKMFKETIAAPNPKTLAEELGEDVAIGDVCFFDIECFKIAAPEDWCLKRRFKTFMVGVGWWETEDVFEGIILWSDEEDELMKNVAEIFASFRFGAFYATRDWDRRVLEGVWTYVRRGLSPVPGSWPNLNCPEEWWVNLNRLPSFKRVDFPRFDRSDDIPSKEIAEMESVADSRMATVTEHNRLDLVEMARRLVAGSKQNY